MRPHLAEAELVFASELTLIEIDRVLHRAGAVASITEGDALRVRTMLNRVAPGWNLVRLVEPVVERARRAFPIEPVRSLDAVHLASAIAVAEDASPIAILSLDERVRRNALALGFEVLPEDGRQYPTSKTRHKRPRGR